MELGRACQPRMGGVLEKKLTAPENQKGHPQNYVDTAKTVRIPCLQIPYLSGYDELGRYV